jgi:hypothetical protein
MGNKENTRDQRIERPHDRVILTMVLRGISDNEERERERERVRVVHALAKGRR